MTATTITVIVVLVLLLFLVVFCIDEWMKFTNTITQYKKRKQ